MNWLNKLERRFGRFGIPNLMMYISTTTLVFSMLETFGGIPVSYWLRFSRQGILEGQIWRLVTFLFVDFAYDISGLFPLLLMLYFYYWVGCRLEYAWGVFRFNLYYVMGTLGAILLGFLLGYTTPTYLNLSLFLAYAALFPDEQILFMMIIPILFQPWPVKLLAVLALANFFIFFWPYISGSIRNYFKYRKVRNNFRNQMRRNNVVKGPWDDPRR